MSAREQPPVEPAASEQAVTPSAWDFDVVLAALSGRGGLHPGSGVAQLFDLPDTPMALEAGARVVSYFTAEAEGRAPGGTGAAGAPRSVQEIKERLAAVAAKRSGSRAGKGSSSSSAAQSSFAAETLARLEAQPAEALQRTHELLVRASSSPLSECMHMEFRATARLLGLEGGCSAASLWGPLGTEDSELSLKRGRSGAAELAAARAREQSNWENALEHYLVSGEGKGVLGDLFRRRHVYFKDPLAEQPFDAQAAEEMLSEDARVRIAEGSRRPEDIAAEELGLQEWLAEHKQRASAGGSAEAAGSGSRGGQRERGGRGAPEPGPEELAIDELAFEIAASDSVHRAAADAQKLLRQSAERVAAEALKAKQRSAVPAAFSQGLQPAPASVGSLKDVPKWLR
jgi:hypothetical protein